jgi:glutamine cyclotransferase
MTNLGAYSAFLGLLFYGLGAYGVEASTKLKLIRKIPHTGYSEGLDFHEGFLWHALPKSLVKIDPKDGTVVEKREPATEYSESLVWAKGGLWNLSFSDNGIYFSKGFSAKNLFKKKGTVPEVHGWGIEFDGKNLIVTGDYSKKLYFLDPETLKVVREIQTEVSGLEDLAFDGKRIWTSSFTEHRGEIFTVDPTTGKILGFYTLPNAEECPVIDGQAYDGKNLWVTGKNCASIYLFELP